MKTIKILTVFVLFSFVLNAQTTFIFIIQDKYGNPLSDVVVRGWASKKDCHSYRYELSTAKTHQDSLAIYMNSYPVSTTEAKTDWKGKAVLKSNVLKKINFIEIKIYNQTYEYEGSYFPSKQYIIKLPYSMPGDVG